MKINKSIGITLIASMTFFTGCYNSHKETTSTSDTPIIDAIMSRRSIRQYTNEPVSRDLLQKVAECGVMAPSSHNNQTWAVRIVDSQEWIDSCSNTYIAAVKEAGKYDQVKFMFSEPYKNIFRNAPAVIFIGTNPSARFACEGIGMLGQNMMLAATDLGLGTCALGTALEIFSEPGMEPFVEDLDFPEGYSLRFAIAIGHPDESPKRTERDFEKIKFVE